MKRRGKKIEWILILSLQFENEMKGKNYFHLNDAVERWANNLCPCVMANLLGCLLLLVILVPILVHDTRTTFMTFWLLSSCSIFHTILGAFCLTPGMFLSTLLHKTCSNSLKLSQFVFVNFPFLNFFVRSYQEWIFRLSSFWSPFSSSFFSVIIIVFFSFENNI